MCGYAVDWLRSCYSSEWRLWPDFPDVRTPGRFVYSPPGTPHAPNPHYYGSRNWHTPDPSCLEGLGEARDTKQAYHYGLAPAPFAPAVSLEGIRPCGKPQDWRFVDVRDNQAGGARTWDVPISRLDLDADPTCGGTATAPASYTSKLVVTVDSPQTVHVEIEGVLPNVPGEDCFGEFGPVAGHVVQIRSPLSGPACDQIHLQDEWDYTLTGPGTFEFELAMQIGGGADHAGGWIEIRLSKDPPFRDRPVELKDGFDVNCFAAAPFWPELQSRQHAADLGDVLATLYTDSATAETMLATFLGPGWTFATDSTTSALGSGTIIATRGSDTIVLITGSTNFTQLALQILYAAPGPQSVGTFAVSPYQYGAALNVQSKIFLSPADPAGRVLLVGHSLGGAIATILGAVYRQAQPGRVIEVLTFGAPRCGDSRFRSVELTNRQVNYANNGDPVPGVPPGAAELAGLFPVLTPTLNVLYQGFEDHPGQRVLYDDGTVEETTESPVGITILLGLAALAVAGMPFPPFAAHELPEYVRRLRLQP